MIFKHLPLLIWICGLPAFCSAQSTSVDFVRKALLQEIPDTLELKRIPGLIILRDTAYNNIGPLSDENMTLEDSLVSLPVGTVIGPFEIDSMYFFFKVLADDSLPAAHAGNIYIDTSRGAVASKARAEDILKSLNEGTEFNTLCLLYTDDRNRNPDCDIGWFFKSYLVKEYSNEVFKHKKGDQFMLKTRFGYHVVKMLDDVQQKRWSARYIQVAFPMQ